MILDRGDKLLVVHRRLYKEDQTRFFIGTVERYESGLACVRGHTWLRDTLAGGYYRKEDIRTKMIPLLSGSLLAYLLPEELELNPVRLEEMDSRLFLTDGKKFRMDLTENEVHHAKAEKKPSNP